MKRIDLQSPRAGTEPASSIPRPQQPAGVAGTNFSLATDDSFQQLYHGQHAPQHMSHRGSEPPIPISGPRAVGARKFSAAPPTVGGAFQCEVCERAYALGAELDSHRMLRHSLPPLFPVDQPPLVAPVVMTAAGAAAVHPRQTTPERRFSMAPPMPGGSFVCEVCQRAYALPTELDSHRALRHNLPARFSGGAGGSGPVRSRFTMGAGSSVPPMMTTGGGRGGGRAPLSSLGGISEEPDPVPSRSSRARRPSERGSTRHSERGSTRERHSSRSRSHSMRAHSPDHAEIDFELDDDDADADDEKSRLGRLAQRALVGLRSVGSGGHVHRRDNARGGNGASGHRRHGEAGSGRRGAGGSKQFKLSERTSVGDRSHRQRQEEMLDQFDEALVFDSGDVPLSSFLGEPSALPSGGSGMPRRATRTSAKTTTLPEAMPDSKAHRGGAGSSRMVRAMMKPTELDPDEEDGVRVGCCRRRYRRNPRCCLACVCAAVCLGITLLVLVSMLLALLPVLNAKLSNLNLAFDDLCTNDGLPLTVSTNLRNPSSVSLAAEPFDLHLWFEDQPLGQVPLEQRLTLAPGDNYFELATRVRVDNEPLLQSFITKLLDKQPIQLDLKIDLPAVAYGVSLTIPVKFKVRLNKPPDPALPDPPPKPKSIELDTISLLTTPGDDDQLGLKLGMRMRGNGTFSAKLPPLSVMALVNGRRIGGARTAPFLYGNEWASWPIDVTLNRQNVSTTAEAFAAFMYQRPLSVRLTGEAGAPTDCWLQRQMAGIRIDVPFFEEDEDMPPSSSTGGAGGMFSRGVVDFRDADASAVHVDMTLELARDLKLRGGLPPIAVTVYNGGAVSKSQAELVPLAGLPALLRISLDQGLSLDPFVNNTFAVALEPTEPAHTLGQFIGNVTAGQPSTLIAMSHGTSMVAEVLSLWRIIIPLTTTDDAKAQQASTKKSDDSEFALTALDFVEDARAAGRAGALATELPDDAIMAAAVSLHYVIDVWQLRGSLSLPMLVRYRGQPFLRLDIDVTMDSPALTLDIAVGVLSYNVSASLVEDVYGGVGGILSMAGYVAPDAPVANVLAVVLTGLAVDVDLGPTVKTAAAAAADDEKKEQSFALQFVENRNLGTHGMVIAVGVELRSPALRRLVLTTQFAPLPLDMSLAVRGRRDALFSRIHMTSLQGHDGLVVIEVGIVVPTEAAATRRTNAGIEQFLKGVEYDFVAAVAQDGASDQALPRMLHGARITIPIASKGAEGEVVEGGIMPIMKLDHVRSTRDTMVVSARFDFDLGLDFFVHVGDLAFTIAFEGADIVHVRHKALSLGPSVTHFDFEVELTAQNDRDKLERAVGSYLIPADPYVPFEFTVHGTIFNVSRADGRPPGTRFLRVCPARAAVGRGSLSAALHRDGRAAHSATGRHFVGRMCAQRGHGYFLFQSRALGPDPARSQVHGHVRRSGGRPFGGVESGRQGQHCAGRCGPAVQFALSQGKHHRFHGRLDGHGARRGRQMERAVRAGRRASAGLRAVPDAGQHFGRGARVQL